ncbi:MAG: hypothetical protein K2Q03_07095 [Sphingobacteriaceae bacterium]|nr:hypothetical protein [Sphingobacteriaceae bacterium]
MNKKLAILLLSSLAFVACKKKESVTETPVAPVVPAKKWMITEVKETRFKFDQNGTPEAVSSTKCTYNDKYQITAATSESGDKKSDAKFTYTDKLITIDGSSSSGSTFRTVMMLDATGRIISEEKFQKASATATEKSVYKQTLTYNAAGYIASSSTPNYASPNDPPYVTNYTYNAEGNITEKDFVFEYGDAIPENLWYKLPFGFEYGSFNYGKRPAKLVTKSTFNSTLNNVPTPQLLYTYEYVKDANGNVTKITSKNANGVLYEIKEYVYTQL